MYFSAPERQLLDEAERARAASGAHTRQSGHIYILLADHRQTGAGCCDLTSNTYLSYRGRLYRFLTSTQPSSGTRSISVASLFFSCLRRVCTLLRMRTSYECSFS